MTLQNLLAIRQLQEYSADPAAVRKLLDAARRNLADARVTEISADNRFDAAYKCLMQCAMLGLWANGHRTSTSKPGHHQTAIQCLGHTMRFNRRWRRWMTGSSLPGCLARWRVGWNARAAISI